MVWALAKILISGVAISFTSWLAGKRPGLAGFLLALPLSSMLALLFSYSEFRDSTKATMFATSIFYAVPLSLLFFVPFLFADKLRWPFLALYASGFVLLVLGFFIHARFVE